MKLDKLLDLGLHGRKKYQSLDGGFVQTTKVCVIQFTVQIDSMIQIEVTKLLIADFTNV